MSRRKCDADWSSHGSGCMTLEEVRELLTAGQWEELESAWALAIEADVPAAEMAAILEAVVAAGQDDLAEVLGWMYLADRAEKLAPQAALEIARAVVRAVPAGRELRAEACELYRRLHGGHEHFEALLSASGLAAEQSPRRAFRTLDTCLALRQGGFVANRFDGRALQVNGYDPAAGEFELTDPAGEVVRLAPLALADEFDPAEENDFRVLRQHRPAELERLVREDPTTVLVGLCLAGGGRTDSSEVRSQLQPWVPREKWSRWWTSARAAAKRCPQLGLEGRNPTRIVYYPQGRSLEEELAPAASAASGPLERLAVLRQYARRLRQLKRPAEPAFVGPIMAALAEQARNARSDPPGALAAALGIAAAAELGLPSPEGHCPTAREVLASVAEPAQAVAAVGDAELWPAAMDALAGREDAAEQFRALLLLAPADRLDEVVGRLAVLGVGQAVADAVAQATAEPLEHLELCLWLWRGPERCPPGAPSKVEVLSALLDAMQEAEADPQRRKAVHRRVRSALAARDYASYREGLEEMTEAVAETFKVRIQRSPGLAQAVREDMLDILRQRFSGLFVRERLAPWEDPNTLWTTEEGLQRRQAMLTEIVEVKMPANEKAIGEAAAHGDLSENSEYKFACEERDFLRARARQLQEELARARIITARDVPADSVGIGSRIRLRRVGDGEELTVTILGVWDTDLTRHVYSYRSALAAAFLGKRVGQTVTLKLEGCEGEYRIEEISSALE